MNKLQLYITKSFDGYKVLFNINPSEEVTRHVRELRKIVGKIKYDASEKNIFYYVTNIASGTFVTIIRTIPVNAVDHLAAWIYIPNELVIDAQTLERVVNITTRKVSGDRVTTEDVAALRELFSAEYLTDPESPAMTASKTNALPAWRAYNGETGVKLVDLFGRGLFQVPYLDYSGVLFVDADLGIEVNADDLTKLPIEGPATILPVARTPEQFTAHVFGRALDCPVRATLNTNLTVVWKHPGFEDVVNQEVITKAEFKPSIPDTSNSRKAITTSSFQIAAQTGQVPLDDCTITVNGVEITDEPHLFNTAELETAMVSITCDGYAPYSAKMDLASSTRALIRIQERTKVYCFEMPVKRADLGAPVRFKLYSKKPVKDSPLEGYSLQDDIVEGESRTNHLSYTGSTMSWTNKAIYVGIGLFAGLILGWITGCGGGNTAPSRVDEPQEVEITEEIIDELVEEPKAATPAATPAPAASAQKQEQTQEQPKKSTIHVVKKGDILSTIARKYNTSVEAIKKANNLQSDNLSIDTELIIPQE